MHVELARRELLAAARERLHVTHQMDVTGQIAAQNACVGIGKIVYALRRLGMQGDVRFVASLDFTITRHAERWASGFSYGGALEILLDGDAIAIPEVRPNTCGTIIGALPGEVDPGALMRRICDARRTRGGAFDYSRKNHFINVYRSTATGVLVFIVHGCPARVKFDCEDGPGLYLETSPHWQARALSIATPLGPLHPLVGGDAIAYWENYRRCEAIAKIDRRAIAEMVFGAFEFIADHTHEGMLAQHIYLHGCHAAPTAQAAFPVMSSIGEPAFLVSRNLCSPTISDGIAILPHGTGYTLQLPAESFEMQYVTDADRLFVGHGGEHKEVYTAFDDVPFAYRSSAEVRAWSAGEMLMVLDELRPQLFLKL